MEYLIAVTVTSADAESERSVYRVDPEATLRDVARRALAMATLSAAPLRLAKLEVLGTLEPHLWPEYRDLLGGDAPTRVAHRAGARRPEPSRGGS